MKALMVLSEKNRIFESSIVEAADANHISLTAFFVDESQNRPFSFWRDKLKQVIRETGIEKILMINDLSSGSEYLADDTVLSMIPCNVWFVDPVQQVLAQRADHLKKYRKVFSYEPADVICMQKDFAISACYLPFPAGKSIFCSQPRSFTEKEDYDIGFVGLVAGNQKRLKVLEAAAQVCREKHYTMALYGHYWHNHHWLQATAGALKFRLNYPTLYPFVHNQNLSPKDVSALYRKTRIILNIHYSDYRVGPSPRTFEIMGNNNFELCDAQDFSQTSLIPGKHLAIYHDTDELKDLLVYYLKNDKERIRIARNGGNEVRAYYTFHNAITVALS